MTYSVSFPTHQAPRYQVIRALSHLLLAGALVLAGTARSEELKLPNLGESSNSLFSPAALEPLLDTGFQPLLEDGFADGPVNGMQILTSQTRPPSRSSPFVYFVQFINLRRGDYLDLSIIGPNGPVSNNQSKPLDRNKASFTAYIGKRNPPPPGTYQGTVKLVRNGEVVYSHTSKPFDFRK